MIRLTSNSSRLPRGQTLVLGAVTLLLIALTVMVTINITIATQAKIKLQNYTDARAFSLAVAEARTLNYFAYTNRAIASAYVGMANVHAYMSEAAMTVDLKMNAAQIMGMIAAEENAQCYCCCSPFGCAPCCFSHCWHAIQAGINAGMLMIDWIMGKQGKRVKALDPKARDVLTALNNHIKAIHLSQDATKVNMVALLSGVSGLSQLKDAQMMGAASVTDDNVTLAAQNLAKWNRLFYSGDVVKRRIMAETVNATRHDFTWNRDGSPVIQAALFLPNWVGQNVKAEILWMGPRGTWGITQSPDTGFMAGGRTAYTDGNLPMQMGSISIVAQDAKAGTVQGRTINSYDHGILAGQWQHGAGVSQMPTLGPIGPGEMRSGQGNAHRADMGILDMFNKPHQGGAHSTPTDMHRFIEFDIALNFPHNQPFTYAGADTDPRVNEYGIRGPWEIASDGSGTVNMDVVESKRGTLTLSDNNRAKAFSKAMVYYHRIGDWRDYPNLFNPFWRAKLHTLSLGEMPLSLTLVDTDAALVAGGIGASGGDRARAVNVQ